MVLVGAEPRRHEAIAKTAGSHQGVFVVEGIQTGMVHQGVFVVTVQQSKQAGDVEDITNMQEDEDKQTGQIIVVGVFDKL